MTPPGRFDPGRRALLGFAIMAPLTSCAKSTPPPARSDGPQSSVVDLTARFEELERRFDARLGVFAVATGTGRTVAHRADERFAFCSTFKALAAAAILAQKPLSHLDTRVTFSRDSIRSISPITQDRVDSGMTIGELCDAAIRYSDGTAGNLLLADIGGPAGLTAYLRTLGDGVSRMDNDEPALNRDAPGSALDTTTPRAIAADYRSLVLGTALPDFKRSLLSKWLLGSVAAPNRIRAAAGPGWSVADKTGTGNYGRANDIAIVRPPSGAPLVVAIMSDRKGGHDAQPSDELVAEAARRVFAALN